jgi:urease accessory protein
MEARAAVVAVRDGPRTTATVLRSAPPLTLRRTDAGTGGTGLTVHLVGSAAGPVGGDDLGLELTVGAGAHLDVRSAAASLAYPGPGGRPSRLAVTATVAAGARLGWRPEPTVLVRGCDHRATTRLSVAAGATVLWREVVVLGRHAEATGSVHQRLRVDVAGRPLLRNDLAVGPRWPASLGPAGIHGARVVGTLLAIGPASEVTASSTPAVRTAAFDLGGGAMMLSALSDSVEAVEAALDSAAHGSCETRTQSTSI